MGLMLTGGGIAAYVYGLLAFIDYMGYPTAFNAYRAWKINFLVTWITVGVAASQVVTFLVAIPHSLTT